MSGTLLELKPLQMRELCETTGYSDTTIYAARRGFTNANGEFRQLTFTHGQRCTPKAVWDFFARNPDFRVRKALTVPAARKRGSS